MSVKNKMPETLVKKMNIAQRINEPLNDKRFKWEANEDGTFSLAGLAKHKVIYRDASDEKHKKGFSVMTAGGKKVLQESTLNVGTWVNAIKEELFEIMEPAAAAPAKRAKATAEA